jgi:hypothetical protein
MPRIPRRLWSRLCDVVGLVRRGEDDLRRQPPWDIPSHRQPDDQPAPDAVINAHDERKKLGDLNAGTGRLEATDPHGGLAKGMLVGAVLGIISWSLFRHYVLHDTATLTGSFLSAANVGIVCGIIVPILVIRVLDRW